MDALPSDALELVSLAEVTMPSLECLLEHIGPLPNEALLLGQAEDDCPVLLDLDDPVPGPLMILGCDGSGKTLFLRSIARFVESTHAPEEIQYGVITNHVEEWHNTLIGNPHCVGVFATGRSGARRFVQSLEMWLRAPRSERQSVLLLVDGFDELLSWDEATLDCLHEVLSSGPKKRVWPIVTMDPGHGTKVEQWVDMFRVQIPQFGLVWNKRDEIFPVPHEIWDSPVHGLWFMLQKQAGWIRFWIPSVSDL